MKTLHNVALAPYTSLNVGGVAESLIFPDDSEEISTVFEENRISFVLGFGCNVLVSDSGLPGNTLSLRNGKITIEDNKVIADAGVWWDDLVKVSIDNSLWGLELMSMVPSSVGGAVHGNIACYGQQVSDSLSWVDVYDKNIRATKRLQASEIDMSYRSSMFQSMPDLIILRAAFQLSISRKQQLTYDSALVIGEELGIKPDTLENTRQIIIKTRAGAGSLFSYDDPNAERSAGSFFKNPMVSTEQAIDLARFDESGKTLERIQHQSKVHGGDSHRASAAHVLLAAGFHRGQTWGPVQLHDKHVLKIVTHDGATATQVYEVTQEILSTVSEKLGIELQPEVKFIGQF